MCNLCSLIQYFLVVERTLARYCIRFTTFANTSRVCMCLDFFFFYFQTWEPNANNNAKMSNIIRTMLHNYYADRTEGYCDVHISRAAPSSLWQKKIKLVPKSRCRRRVRYDATVVHTSRGRANPRRPIDIRYAEKVSQTDSIRTHAL